MGKASDQKINGFACGVVLTVFLLTVCFVVFRGNITHDTASNRIYLPPSFMDGVALSGVHAPTSNTGASPIPMLFKISSLTSLPNDLKADLRGCFVVADAKGNLASERVEATLVVLSCLNNEGKAVIAEQVKGYVADEDGKIGLRGRVVPSAGAVLSKSFLRGFSSSGIKVTDKLRKFDLDVSSHLMLPMVEVDARRKVTIVTSKGVWLNIKR